MRKISNLLNHGGKIYIFIRSEHIKKVFQRNAEAEGFAIERISGDLFVLKEDWTLRGAGFVDHMCFCSMTPKMGDGSPIFRIDYGKYLSGADDYFYKKP